MTQAKIVEVDETWESETLSPVGLAHLLPKIVNKGFTVEVEGHTFPGQAEPPLEKFAFPLNEHQMQIVNEDRAGLGAQDDYALAFHLAHKEMEAEAEAARDAEAPASRDDGPGYASAWRPCVRCGKGGTSPGTQVYTNAEGLCGDCASNEPEKAAMELTGKKRKRSNAERKNRKAKR